MRSKYRQQIFLIVSILWMAVIFWFSAHTGNESSAQSGGIVDTIIRLLFPHYSEWATPKQELYLHLLTLLVRKAGHATEYLILALLYAGCMSWKRTLKGTLFSAWLLTVLYAATDEVHQFFVPDRACRITDIVIDSAGAAVGLLLLGLFLSSLKPMLLSRKGVTKGK